MESNAVVVSKCPTVEEEAKNLQTITGTSAKIKKAVIVALAIVPATDHQGKFENAIGIMTSTILNTIEDKKGRPIEKAKIEIMLEQAEKLDTTNATVTPKKAADQKA
ncbi:hypothetical protein PTKIN_Ptkin10aG0045400 [Pterospermum kingtungense]